MIVEYKLHKVKARSDNMKTPIWIDDGGHWFNSNDHSYVGCVRDDVEYYVPTQTLTVFTKETFHQRIMNIHAVTPYMDVGDPAEIPEPTEMTDAEVGVMANTWWDAKAAEFNTD